MPDDFVHKWGRFEQVYIKLRRLEGLFMIVSGWPLVKIRILSVLSQRHDFDILLESFFKGACQALTVAMATGLNLGPN